MTVALYLRLSNEDTDLKNSEKTESESISNQRCLLYDYLASHPEFAGAEIVEFCDDGWSGTNFERPAMKEMLEQIRAGQIGCVCVKDLSRFGRDYLTVGNYISRVFPFLGVRFIAVNDGFDSIRPQDIDSLETSFKALIYDLYSRDLSEKIKSARRQRAEQGLYISAYAPYGYRKDPKNKNRLLIDEEAAKIVRRIFQEIADGKSTHEIAVGLNSDEILTPMQYKKQTGCTRHWNAVHEDNFWTTKAITRILRDERYTGTIVNEKRRTTEIATTKSEQVDRSEWIVSENRHEAIVSKELFGLAQETLGTRQQNPPSGRTNILRRKIYCGCCGLAMERSDSKSHSYFCRNRNLNTGYDCPTEGVPEQDILDAVSNVLCTYIRLAVDLEAIYRQQEEKHRIERKHILQQLTALQNEKRRRESTLQELYEGFVEGKCSKERYLSEKKNLSERIQEITASINSLETELREKEPDKEADKILRLYARDLLYETPMNELYLDLFDRVNLYKDGRIEVKLNFSDDLLRLSQKYNAVEPVKTAFSG